MVVDAPAFITKVLLPRQRTDVLRRSRLVDFLHQHIDRRLVLVSAPAGYGKTTLLVDFAHDVNIPVCWYTLGATDVDVRIFLEYLIAAIRQRFPHFGHRTEAVLRSTIDLGKELSAVVGVLVNEMHAAIPEYFIVVLDDYHVVDGSDQVNAAVDLLLHYLPENCHLVVSSRSIPRLTLSRMAAHRQVAGLGCADMRFTAEEIRRLLGEHYKVLLPTKSAEAVAAESEGWITAVILSTQAATPGLLDSIARAKGAGAEVFDYLASEVFEQQPAAVQRFLLASSVLEQANAQLCAQLLDCQDAADQLLYLEDANLFITRLEGAGGWYRYHQLFKAFLESKLLRDYPEWHRSLQRRAADASVARAAWDEAILYYVRAEAYDRAAAIVAEQATAMLDAGALTTLARWIDSLPAAIVAEQPRLLLYRGRIYFKSGEPERGLELLNQAYGQFVERHDQMNMARALAVRSIGLAIKARYDEAVADCRRALDLAGETDACLTAEVHRSLGICQGMRGNFHHSAIALGEALRLLRNEDDPYGTATLHHSLGIANGKLGKLAVARFHFEQALGIWQRLGNAGCWGDTLNSLGVLLQDEGDHEAALVTLTEALDKAREGNYLRAEASALANIGDAHASCQRYREAVDHYERSLETARRIEEGYLVGYALNGLGDTYARLGDQRRAERLIRQAIVQAEERGSDYERGMYETSLGMLRCDQGDSAKALRSLVRACELLRSCGAKRELTRALFGRARALHLAARVREAMLELQSALDLGAEIDYADFLVRDGKRCEALLFYARDHGVADARLIAALETLHGAADLPSPPVAVRSLQAVALPHAAPLQAFALGQARVLRDGKEITRNRWASDKVRELFFFLLSHPYSLRREQIVESLWPDLPSGSYSSTFHSTIYRLRRSLHDEYVVQRDGRYRIGADVECYYDVVEFERFYDEAERLARDSVEADAAYRRALAIYRGPYLKEFDSEWCVARRAHLAAKHLNALARVASAAESRGDYGESIELCEQVLSEDNLRDEAHYILLRCHVALGDHAAALRHYHRYASLLRDELGIDPPVKVHAVYEQILRGNGVSSTTPLRSRRGRLAPRH